MRQRRRGSRALGTSGHAAYLNGQEGLPMTISIIVGGWLAFNVLFVVALLFRRDRPAQREKLLHWVISGTPPKPTRRIHAIPRG